MYCKVCGCRRLTVDADRRLSVCRACGSGSLAIPQAAFKDPSKDEFIKMLRDNDVPTIERDGTCSLDPSFIYQGYDTKEYQVLLWRRDMFYSDSTH